MSRRSSMAELVAAGVQALVASRPEISTAELFGGLFQAARAADEPPPSRPANGTPSPKTAKPKATKRVRAAPKAPPKEPCRICGKAKPTPGRTACHRCLELRNRRQRRYRQRQAAAAKAKAKAPKSEPPPARPRLTIVPHPDAAEPTTSTPACGKPACPTCHQETPAPICRICHREHAVLGRKACQRCRERINRRRYATLDRKRRPPFQHFRRRDAVVEAIDRSMGGMLRRVFEILDDDSPVLASLSDEAGKRGRWRFRSWWQAVAWVCRERSSRWRDVLPERLKRVSDAIGEALSTSAGGMDELSRNQINWPGLAVPEETERVLQFDAFGNQIEWPGLPLPDETLRVLDPDDFPFGVSAAGGSG